MVRSSHATPTGPLIASSHLLRLTRPWSAALASLDPRWFYVGLACVLGVWVVAVNLFDREHHREASTYDYDPARSHR